MTIMEYVAPLWLVRGNPKVSEYDEAPTDDPPELNALTPQACLKYDAPYPDAHGRCVLPE